MIENSGFVEMIFYFCDKVKRSNNSLREMTIVCISKDFSYEMWTKVRK